MESNTYVDIIEDKIIVGATVIDKPVDVRVSTIARSEMVQILRAPSPISTNNTAHETVITLDFIFSGEDELNHLLQELIAQFTVFPFISIRSVSLSKAFYPIDRNEMNYYGFGSELYKNKMTTDYLSSNDLEIESLNALMNLKNIEGNNLTLEEVLYSMYAPLYAVRGYAVKTLPGNKNTITLTLTLGVMDQLSVSPFGYVSYIADDVSLLGLLYLNYYDKLHLTESTHPRISKSLHQMARLFSRNSIPVKSKYLKVRSKTDLRAIDYSTKFQQLSFKSFFLNQKRGKIFPSFNFKQIEPKVEGSMVLHRLSTSNNIKDLQFKMFKSVILNNLKQTSPTIYNKLVSNEGIDVNQIISTDDYAIMGNPQVKQHNKVDNTYSGVTILAYDHDGNQINVNHFDVSGGDLSYDITDFKGKKSLVFTNNLSNSKLTALMYNQNDTMYSINVKAIAEAINSKNCNVKLAYYPQSIKVDNENYFNFNIAFMYDETTLYFTKFFKSVKHYRTYNSMYSYLNKVNKTKSRVLHSLPVIYFDASNVNNLNNTTMSTEAKTILLPKYSYEYIEVYDNVNNIVGGCLVEYVTDISETMTQIELLSLENISFEINIYLNDIPHELYSRYNLNYPINVVGFNRMKHFVENVAQYYNDKVLMYFYNNWVKNNRIIDSEDHLSNVDINLRSPKYIEIANDIVKLVDNKGTLYSSQSQVYKKYYRSILESSYEFVGSNRWKLKSNKIKIGDIEYNDTVAYALIKPYNLFRTYNSNDVGFKLYYKSLNVDDTVIETRILDMLTHTLTGSTINDIYYLSDWDISKSNKYRYPYPKVFGFKALFDLFEAKVEGVYEHHQNPFQSNVGKSKKSMVLLVSNIIGIMYTMYRQKSNNTYHTPFMATLPSVPIKILNNLYTDLKHHNKEKLYEFLTTLKVNDSHVRTNYNAIRSGIEIAILDWDSLLGIIKDNEYLTYDVMVSNNIKHFATGITNSTQAKGYGLLNVIFSIMLYYLSMLTVILKSEAAINLPVKKFIADMKLRLTEFHSAMSFLIASGLFTEYSKYTILDDDNNLQFKIKSEDQTSEVNILLCDNLNVANSLFTVISEYELLDKARLKLKPIFEAIAISGYLGHGDAIWMYKKIEINDSSLTSIVAISCDVQNNVIPIYKDGHVHPTYQSMGGPVKKISIQMNTKDLSLIGQLMYVAEYATSYDSYFAKIKMNRAASKTFVDNLLRKSIQSRTLGENTYSSLIERSHGMFGNNRPNIYNKIDGNLLIKSNLLNFLGIYATVIDSVVIDNMEENDITFNVQINLIAIDQSAVQYTTPQLANTGNSKYYMTNTFIAEASSVIASNVGSFKRNVKHSDQNEMYRRNAILVDYGIHRMVVGLLPLSLALYNVVNFTKDMLISHSSIYSDINAQLFGNTYYLKTSEYDAVEKIKINNTFEANVLLLSLLTGIYYGSSESTSNLLIGIKSNVGSKMVDTKISELFGVNSSTKTIYPLLKSVSDENSFRGLMQSIFVDYNKLLSDFQFSRSQNIKIIDSVYFEVYNDLANILVKDIDKEYIQSMIFKVVLDLVTSISNNSQRVIASYNITVDTIPDYDVWSNIKAATNSGCYISWNKTNKLVKFGVDGNLLKFIFSMIHYFKIQGVLTYKEFVDIITKTKDDQFLNALIRLLFEMKILEFVDDILDYTEYIPMVLLIGEFIFQVYGTFIPLIAPSVETKSDPLVKSVNNNLHNMDVRSVFVILLTQYLYKKYDFNLFNINNTSKYSPVAVSTKLTEIYNNYSKLLLNLSNNFEKPKMKNKQVPKITSSILKSVFRLFNITDFSPYSYTDNLITSINSYYYSKLVYTSLLSSDKISNTTIPHDLFAFDNAIAFTSFNTPTLNLIEPIALSDLSYNDIPQVALFDLNVLNRFKSIYESKYANTNKKELGGYLQSLLYQMLPVLNTVLTPAFFIYPHNLINKYRYTTVDKLDESKIITQVNSKVAEVAKNNAIKSARLRAYEMLSSISSYLKDRLNYIRSLFIQYSNVLSEGSNSGFNRMHDYIDDRIEILITYANNIAILKTKLYENEISKASNKDKMKVKKEVFRTIVTNYDNMYNVVDNLLDTFNKFIVRSPNFKLDSDKLMEELKHAMSTLMEGIIEDMNVVNHLGKDLDIMDKSIHPFSEQYSLMSTFFKLEQNTLMTNPISSKLITNYTIKYKNKLQSAYSNTIEKLFPVVKLYFIAEVDNKLYMFDDIYSYAGIQSISIRSERTSPIMVANLNLIDTYGLLTYIYNARTDSKLTPLELNPQLSESLNALMLKVGANLQIRMGYGAYLSVKNIVFNGKITQIESKNGIVSISATSQGASLLTDISSKDIAIYNNFNMFSLDENQTESEFSVRFIAKLRDINASLFSDFSESGSIKDKFQLGDTLVDASAIRGTFNLFSMGDNLFTQYSNAIIREMLGVLPQPYMYDQLLINVDVKRPFSYYTTYNRFQALVNNVTYNPTWLYPKGSTAWEALLDLSLHYPNSILTVRPFKDTTSIVFKHMDDSYVYDDNAGFVTSDLTNIIEIFNLYKRHNLRYKVHVMYEYMRILDILKNSNQSIGYYVLVKALVKFKTINDIKMGVSSNSNEEQLTFTSALYELTHIFDALEYDFDSITDVNTFIDYPGLESDYIKLKQDLNITTLDVNILEMPNNEFNRLYKSKRTLYVFYTDFFDAFAKYLESLQPNRRMVSEFHYKEDSSDIISNGMYLTDSPNAVSLSYLPQDDIVLSVMRGTLSKVLPQNMVAFIDNFMLNGFTNRNIKALRASEKYIEALIPISTTIPDDKLKIYSTSVPNASNLRAFGVDEYAKVARRILNNIIKNYYAGEIVVMGDSEIFPFDVVYLNDTYNDIAGPVGVKSVTHNFSVNGGFTTTIEPDLLSREVDRSSVKFGFSFILDVILDTILPVAIPAYILNKKVRNKLLGRSASAISSIMGAIHKKLFFKQAAILSKAKQISNSIDISSHNVIAKKLVEVLRNVDVNSKSAIDSITKELKSALIDSLVSAVNKSSNALKGGSIYNTNDVKLAIDKLSDKEIIDFTIIALNPGESAANHIYKKLFEPIQGLDETAKSVFIKKLKLQLMSRVGDSKRMVKIDMDSLNKLIKSAEFNDLIDLLQTIPDVMSDQIKVAPQPIPNSILNFLKIDVNKVIDPNEYDYFDIIDNKLKFKDGIVGNALKTKMPSTFKGEYFKNMVNLVNNKIKNNLSPNIDDNVKSGIKKNIANVLEKQFKILGTKYIHYTDSVTGKQGKVSLFTLLFGKHEKNIKTIIDNDVDNITNTLIADIKNYEALSNADKVEAITKALNESNLMQVMSVLNYKKVMSVASSNQLFDYVTNTGTTFKQLFKSMSEKDTITNLEYEQFGNNLTHAIYNTLNNVMSAVENDATRVLKNDSKIKSMLASTYGRGLKVALGYMYAKVAFSAVKFLFGGVGKSFKLLIKNDLGFVSDNYSIFLTGVYKAGEPFIANLDGFTKIKLKQDTKITAKFDHLKYTIKRLNSAIDSSIVNLNL